MEPTSIRVYRLFDPGVFAGNADVLARILSGNAIRQSETQTFNVSPASGWLYYADNDALWKDDAFSDLPRTAEAAESAARQFLSNANLRAANSTLFRKAGLRGLFPENLVSAGNALVPRIDTGKPAHWLCWFSVTLPTGIAQPDATVTFAMIEVRVGIGGKVAGLWSRWRPPIADETVTRVPPPNLNGGTPPSPAARIPSVSSAQSSKNGGDENALQLVYLAADENVVQTRLMPYYMITNDDFALVAPASSHSFIVNIDQTVNRAGIDLRAVVTGGSGNYSYHWARLSPISVWSEGMQDLGSDDQVQLDVGLHNVVLMVQDKLTGARFQTELNVYA